MTYFPWHLILRQFPVWHLTEQFLCLLFMSLPSKLTAVLHFVSYMYLQILYVVPITNTLEGNNWHVHYAFVA